MTGLKYTLVVSHPDTLTPVALLAGQPVPEWAQGMVQPEDYEDGQAPEASGEAEPYKGLKVDDLKAEIGRRNENRPADEQIPTDGKRDDLVAALVADDTK